MGNCIAFHPVLRLKAIPPINLVGNLLGAGVTFIWFAVIEPGLAGEVASVVFWDRLRFFLVLLLSVLVCVVPINLVTIFLPVVRELREMMAETEDQDHQPDQKWNALVLLGKIMDLPIKISVATFSCWVICAAVYGLGPHLLPDLFPWPPERSHKMMAWMIFVGAPTTVIFVYFVQEWWLRSTIHQAFSAEVLSSVPPSYRINVLPKMLVATLTIGVVPMALISHVTLSKICDIQTGKLSLVTFLSEMPHAIGFLMGWTAILAVGLSLFMSKSISEPLRYARAAVDKIRKGDLDSVVPVVSNDDIGLMGEQLNRMIKEHKELDSIRETFGQYLSEEVVAEILKSPAGVELRGEIRVISVLVSDLRGFTQIAESEHPQTVLEIINRYLETMTNVIIRHEGTIDEFTGDGILVFFGAPRHFPDHAGRAVACALEMQASMNKLNAENAMLGLPQLQMGIGINAGELIVGNIGCDKRKKYGAVGSPINVAFRVEGHTSGGEILLTQSVCEYLNGELDVQSSREVTLKGIEKPVTLFGVRGLRRQSP